MAAPRSSSLRALRLLSQQHTATPSIRRGLHITGANSAQPANVSDKTSLYSARSLPDLKGECQRRSLRANGSHSEVCDLTRLVFVSTLPILPLVVTFTNAASASSSWLNAWPTMTSCSPAPSALPCGESTAAPLPSKSPIYPPVDHHRPTTSEKRQEPRLTSSPSGSPGRPRVVNSTHRAPPRPSMTPRRSTSPTCRRWRTSTPPRRAPICASRSCPTPTTTTRRAASPPASPCGPRSTRSPAKGPTSPSAR